MAKKCDFCSTPCGNQHCPTKTNLKSFKDLNKCRECGAEKITLSNGKSFCLKCTKKSIDNKFKK